jgi:hypothetical protein
MSVDSKKLLQDLRRQVRGLEDDLRAQAQAVPTLRESLSEEYERGRAAERIGDAFDVWRDEQVTQAAVHWVLGCVFVRFLEDNDLIAEPLLAGTGERTRMAAERQTLYFRQHPTDNDRHYLHHVFGTVAELPAASGLFDRAHNPVWRFEVSADAARDLIGFWRYVNPDNGRLEHDFTDPEWNTRFLGDLYQDLSEAAQKKYALLQTPEFVEEFILDRTLEPAIREFGLEQVHMIDPTCGSGHFVLGGFERLLKRWREREPATPERALVQRALDGVYGVDLNPFAVAIARFRLLVAALRASGIKRLAQAPGYQMHLATSDSLLFGAREGELNLGDAAANLRLMQVGFHAEDADEAHRILSQRYHAVVGNPPYITVKDRALNRAYRRLYSTCHMKYALSVPFIERFWQLAIRGSEKQPAAYIGMINANSFMKREFGKKVVEEFFPRVDLTHVIDTSGAYIPGHGTPTVILFGRNRRPVGASVRAVMGIKGEPNTPANPAHGQVWTAITAQLEDPGSESEFVSVADTPREWFLKHPWSIGGGGAAELKEAIDATTDLVLDDVIKSAGFMAITGEDEFFIAPTPFFDRHQASAVTFRAGDSLRDWRGESGMSAFFPYDMTEGELHVTPRTTISRHFQAHLWSFRSILRNRKMFGKLPEESGIAWHELRFFVAERFLAPLLIVRAEIATHNHFVLRRGNELFNQGSPIIEMPEQAGETEHLELLGLLNSSVAGFWLKQVTQNKGSTVDQAGARQRTAPFEDFYQFNGTKVGRFPVPEERPLDLAQKLDGLAQALQEQSPAANGRQHKIQQRDWQRRRTNTERIYREMIALQEELDWRCYRIYGITDAELTYQDADGNSLAPPEIQLGERAFEIVLARRMSAGDGETTWFARHGSTPITELPSHWPEDYRRLIDRRIERIKQDRYVGLVEQSQYKRRWNVESWEEQEKRALGGWLMDRLESAAFWPEPRLQTTRELASRAERDTDFMAVAEMYQGHAGVNVAALVKDLVEAESVAFLPLLRYKESGLRNRAVWERTWDLQRLEDAIDARVAAELTQPTGENETQFRKRVEDEQKRRKAAEVGGIPRPPKYKSSDFQNTTYWRQRGALDVPKERFISYPFCGPEGEPSLLLGWAGWNHLEQAHAIAGWYNELGEREGWPVERLKPLLAGLSELIPWLKQWHNEVDPVYDQRLGDFYETFLQGQLHTHGLTREAVGNWSPPAAAARRRGRSAASR